MICTKAGISRRTGERVVDTSRRAMLSALDGSLRRLGTDHVDLWLAHTWSDDVPLEETLSALDARGVQRPGPVRRRLQLLRLADAPGPRPWQQAAPGRAPLVATQVEYSLLQRGVEGEVLPVGGRRSGSGVLAWSPLGRGVLTGKYRTGTPADSRAASPHFAALRRALPRRPRAGASSTRVVTAADGLGCSPAEIALAWVRDRPGRRGAGRRRADGGAAARARSPARTSSCRRRSGTRWTRCPQPARLERPADGTNEAVSDGLPSLSSS